MPKKATRPPAALDTFTVSNVDLGCRYLYLKVEVFSDYKALQSTMSRSCRRSFKDNTMACFTPCSFPSRHKGLVGIIKLPAFSVKSEFFALHESIHAAFHISRYKRFWAFDDETEREEFIARTAEYIFERIKRQFKLKKQYV